MTNLGCVPYCGGTLNTTITALSTGTHTFEAVVNGYSYTRIANFTAGNTLAFDLTGLPQNTRTEASITGPGGLDETISYTIIFTAVWD